MQSICWCIQWERTWYVLPSWGRNWKGVSLVIYAKKPIFSTTPWTSVFPRIGCASTSTWHDFVQHCSECMWKGRRVEGGIGTSGGDGRLQSWGQKIMNLLWPSLHSCKHWSHQANTELSGCFSCFFPGYLQHCMRSHMYHIIIYIYIHVLHVWGWGAY